MKRSWLKNITKGRTKLKTISKVGPKWKKSTKTRTKWLFKPNNNICPLILVSIFNFSAYSLTYTRPSYTYTRPPLLAPPSAAAPATTSCSIAFSILFSGSLSLHSLSLLIYSNFNWDLLIWSVPILRFFPFNRHLYSIRTSVTWFPSFFSPDAVCFLR